jgi:phosphoglucosamine mutase
MNYFINNQKNIFKNSCIRSIAGTELLQTEQLILLGKAISTLLHEEFEEPCNILIATDNRPSSPSIKQALVQGLASYDHEIYDGGICPTPFVAKALSDYNQEDNDQESDNFDDQEIEDGFFSLGIVITASHNPSEYNGIKILTEFGYLTEEIELEISKIFYNLAQKEKPKLLEKSNDCIDIDLITFYQEQLSDELDTKALRNISVTMDCANGATSGIAPKIFQTLGMKVIAINNEGNGTLINKDSSCSNQTLLLETLQKNKTDWAVSFDGDGDRVIIAHKSGRIFDGDDLLVILSQHPNFQQERTFVGTIMTNQGIAEFFEKKYKKLIRAQVGERNVIEALMNNQAMLGTETCGHITVMQHAFCSDGIFTALLFFETITKNPVSLNVSYNKYAQLQTTIPLNNKTLDKKTINMILSQYPQQDMRIVVRPSNTEPILRIMVEHKETEKAELVLNQLKNSFTKLV